MTSSTGETYMLYSPPPFPRPPLSPHFSGLRSAAALSDQESYLFELLAEEQKLGPFMAVLPHGYRLLKEEILRVSRQLENASVLGHSGLEHAGPMVPAVVFPNAGADMHRWRSQLQSGPATQNWSVSQDSLSRPNIKRIRVDIPVDQYPDVNFAELLLGPLGNSIKRIEEITGCRIFLKGHGSTRNPAMEEMMRGQPGCQHLNEPLHVIIEAELPADIVDTQLVQAHGLFRDLITRC